MYSGPIEYRLARRAIKRIFPTAHNVADVTGEIDAEHEDPVFQAFEFVIRLDEGRRLHIRCLRDATSWHLMRRCATESWRDELECSGEFAKSLMRYKELH